MFKYNISVFPLLQQTKRKLDDASKRLEFLYDKLREQTVSLWGKERFMIIIYSWLLGECVSCQRSHRVCLWAKLSL